MLSRFISKSCNLRLITLISSQSHLRNLKPTQPDPFISNTNPCIFSKIPHLYSTNSNNDNNGKDSSTTSTSHLWNLSSETDESINSVFDEESGAPEQQQKQQLKSVNRTQDWKSESLPEWADGDKDIFREVVEERLPVPENDVWATVEGYKPWSFAGDDKKEEEEDLFDVGEGEGREEDSWELAGRDLGVSGEVDLVGKKSQEEKKLEMEEKELEMEEKNLTTVLKGPNRAFGDLIAASGITEAMLDSLIALKDLEGIQGLRPLQEIEDIRFEKSTRKSSRAEIERQKQEEVAKARVRQVDEKGRAYGTGRRKCSIARVWVQAGDGNFLVNGKEFDVYFPMLDHRAALLRPFSETKTLGMWDVKCTVKGGGVSGQVGAIRLGISRALQNWAPDMRPPLREAGFLTRDSRVVERKKPGKAKARKSFQWVKR